MKAMVYRKYGGPEVLEAIELAIPEPGPGEILVRVSASSVNPIDWKIASGKLWPLYRAKFPQGAGFDIAGEVVRCGLGVSGYVPGVRVHARLRNSVATAEYALAGIDVLATIPKEMDDTTAAGLPLAGMTALQGLRDHGGLPLKGAQQRVLVIGASGGVGHLAVQIAKSAGAIVTGVCSAANRAFVESLGAHEVLDYGAPDPYRALAPCDIILDCVGQQSALWFPHLKPDGRFVSTLPSLDLALQRLNLFRKKRAMAVMLKANARDLQILDDLFCAGQLRLSAQRFPMDQLRDAWSLSISGRVVGKIVVDIKAQAAAPN